MGLTALEHVQTEQSAFTPPGGLDFDIVPFGIHHLDGNFIMGVMPTDAQIRGIQGIEGTRKTTLAFNLIINQCLSGKLPAGHKIVYDILETGMSLEKCITILRCILATKYMIYRHYSGTRAIGVDDDPVEYLNKLFRFTSPELETSSSQEIISAITYTYGGQKRNECELKYDVIRRWYFNKWHLTALQTEAWIIAGDALQRFPLEFFGPSGHYDRDVGKVRSTPTTNIDLAYRRWAEILDTCETAQFWIDHINAYDVSGVVDDYNRQMAVIPVIKRFIGEHRCTFWLLAQEGVSNRRDFDAKGEVLGSKGGSLLKAEADTNWRVSYPRTTDPFSMILHQPVKSREGDHPDLKLMLEPNSGAIFGKSAIKPR